MLFCKRQITFIIITLLFIPQINGQVDSYGEKIDSLWEGSYKRHGLLNKKEKMSDLKFEYSFNKNTLKLRSVIAWHMPTKPSSIIFFYMDDSLVMVSPAGQDPYYIQNNKLVSPKSPLHDSEEIEFFIAKGNEYRLLAYKKIGRPRNKI